VWDDPTFLQAVAAIMTALGGGTLLTSLGRTIWKWTTGRAGRERDRNRSIDEEMEMRRRALDYAQQLRGQLYEAHIQPLPWPDGLGAPQRRSRSAAEKEKP
jgi:hypothetical protein